jgi:hypothetical protein
VVIGADTFATFTNTNFTSCQSTTSIVWRRSCSLWYNGIQWGGQPHSHELHLHQQHMYWSSNFGWWRSNLWFEHAAYLSHTQRLQLRGPRTDPRPAGGGKQQQRPPPAIKQCDFRLPPWH